MLEGLVAWVLNNYLGKYVENLNTDQLSIALLQGAVELENLPLRKDALRHIGLPIEVRAGFIGKIRLKVPVSQIRSAPWEITIEQLYLVVGPVRLSEWDEEGEDHAVYEYKLSLLDAIEARWRAETDTAPEYSYYASSYSSWLGYGASLVTNIVDNLQLKISDVHFRYEDELTVPGCGLVLGLQMESLTAHSCDEQWNPNASSRDRSSCFKLLQLSSLAVYWDNVSPDQLLGDLTIPQLSEAMGRKSSEFQHNYLLNPVSAVAQTKRNRSEYPLRSRMQPRIQADLKFEQVCLALTDKQFGQMVSCVKMLDSVTLSQRYRKHRPSVGALQDPRAWWQYAFRCIVTPHQTWATMHTRAKENISYVDIYSKLLNTSTASAPLPPESKQIKDKVEWERGFDELRTLREVAMCRVRPPPLPKAQSGHVQGRSVLVSWFPQWWGWYSSPTPAPDSDATTQPATQQVTQALEEEILDALADTVENSTLLKRDTVFAQINFTINHGTFNLCTNILRPVMELQFEKVRLGLESRPRTGSHCVQVELGSLSLHDNLTEDSAFPVLISPQSSESAPSGRPARNLPPGLQRLLNLSSDIKEEPLFQLSYEYKPFNSPADYRLEIRSEALDVVYNPGAVKWLIDFFVRPFQTSDPSFRVTARQGYNAMKQRTKQELLSKWDKILQGNQTVRKMWDMDLAISAPQIFLVEHFNDKNAVLCVVDLGKLHFTNREHSRDVKVSVVASNDEEDEEEAFQTPCSTPPGSEASLSPVGSPLNESFDPNGSISELAIHHKLYDRYSLDLNDLQILVGRVKDNWKFAHVKGTSALHVLDRFSISLQVERRIVYTMDPQFPSLTLSGNLPKLVVHVNEQKIIALRTLFDVISGKGLPSPFRSQEGTPEEEKTAPAEDPGGEKSLTVEESQDTSGAKLLMLQFSVDQLALEVQSRSRSVAELQVSGVRVSYTKRTYDTSLTLSVHGLLLVDALQTFGPDFELLVASHKHVGMDSVSGSLRDSEPTSPTSPGSPDPLCSRALRGFTTTSPSAITTALSSLSAEANRAKSPVGLYAASPPFLMLTPRPFAQPLELPSSEALIVLELVSVSADCPTNTDTREHLQIANIQFNNLDIIANQETIVELMGFVKRVFPSKPTHHKPPVPLEPEDEQVSTSSGGTSRRPSFVSPPSTKIQVTFDFHRLNILLLRAVMKDNTVIGRKIATVTLSNAKINAAVGEELMVEGSLGGLQVLDLTPEGRTHQRILSLGQDPLTETLNSRLDLMACLSADLYNMSGPSSLTTYSRPDKEAFSFTLKRQLHLQSDSAAISIRFASVWYTHSPHLLLELQSCAKEFKQYMANLARSIGTAATEMAIGLVHARAESLAQSLSMSSRLYGSATDIASTPRKRRRSSLSQSMEMLDAGSGRVTNTQGTVTPFSPSEDNLLRTRIEWDVILDTPVLVLPRKANSAQVLVAHLGRMSLTNQQPQVQPSSPSGWLDSSADQGEHYDIQIRDMNVYTLDVQKHLTDEGMMQRVDKLYNCAEGKPVLHDTVIQMTLDHQCGQLTMRQSDNLLLESGPEFTAAERQNTVQVRASVVTPLKVSLTRHQYEQVLETASYMVSERSTVQASEVSEYSERALQDIEEDTELTGVSTLNLDPKLRARMYVNTPPTQELKQQNAFVLKASMDLPVFTVELKADLGFGEQGLVDLSFRDLQVHFDKSHQLETNIQMSLRSLLMEDLLQPADSKYRHLMSCSQSSPGVPLSAPVSHSCPNLAAVLHSGDNAMHISLPDHLHTDSPFANKYRHQTDQSSIPKRTATTGMSEMYPSTPPPSPRGTVSPSPLLFNEDNLVHINVELRAPRHTSQSMSRLVNIDFNSLDVLVNVKSWVVVLDFFGISSTQPDLDKRSPAGQPHHTSDMSSADKPEMNTELELSVKSLCVVLNHAEYEVARAVMSQLTATIVTQAGSHVTHTEASVGSLSLADLTPTHGQLYREKFITAGLSLVMNKYNTPDLHLMREYDTSLRLDMTSVQYVHTKRFIVELQAFFRQFSHLQRLLDSIRSARQISEWHGPASRLKLEISAASPVLLLPMSSRSSEVLVADLGKLYVTNQFVMSGTRSSPTQDLPNSKVTEVLLDAMQVQLDNMDILTGERSTEPLAESVCMGSYYVRIHGGSLLTEKCQLQLQVETNLMTHIAHPVPDMSIRGTLSTLAATIDINQYKLIKGVLAFNVGENTDDLQLSKPPTVPLEEEVCNVWLWNSIHLELVDVSVCLKRKDHVTLACVNFVKSHLNVDSFSDYTQDVDLVSQEILITDIRYQDEPANKRANTFTNILQPILMSAEVGTVQAQVHHRRLVDMSKFTILLNNMRLMAILDWWEMTRDFILENPVNPCPVPVNVEEKKSSVEEQPPFEMKLNITNSEIVFVEDTSQWDSNAVILKSTTVITYRPQVMEKPLSCNLNHCEMFSCILGMEDETALSIIDPVTVNIEIVLDNLVKTLKVQMVHLSLRLSYHDVRMFSQMLESLPKQTRWARSHSIETPDQTRPANFRHQIVKLRALGFTENDCGKALEKCNGQLDDAALWLTHNALPMQETHQHNAESNVERSFTVIEVETDCLSVCVIDDCRDADVPLLELTLASLMYKQDLANHVGSANCTLNSDYYNRVLSGWEPFLEPWPCSLQWEQNSERTEVFLSSEDTLNVNITSTLVELFNSVKETWTQDYYHPKESSRCDSTANLKSIGSPVGYRRRSPFVPFALRNESGSRLWYTTIITSNNRFSFEGSAEGKRTESYRHWVSVDPGQTIPFSFEERGKMRHRYTHKVTIHQLGVRVEGWKEIDPVTVDRVGVYFRLASPDYTSAHSELPKARVVLEVTLEGSARKLVTVRSALQLCNQLEHRVEVKLDNTHIHSGTPMHLTASPGATLSIPLSHAMAQMWVRPLDQAQVPTHYHAFCNRPISWQHVTHPNQLNEELRQCHSNRGLSYRFSVVVKRENYPVETPPPVPHPLSNVCMQPAHTVTLLSALTVVNLLPYELTYSIRDMASGRVRPGHHAAIHQVDQEHQIEINLGLENYPGVGTLTIPPFPVCLTHKLKLRDQSNRRLQLTASVTAQQGTGLKVTVSAQYWLVNKTGLPLVFRQEGVATETAGQYEEHEVARMVAPLLFSFVDQDASPTVVARVGSKVHPEGTSQWCQHFRLQPGVQVRRLRVTLWDNRPDLVYVIGIDIRPGRGRYRCTEIVTLSAHYQIHNKSSYRIQFAQLCFATTVSDPGAQVTYLTAVPDCSLAFHWPRLDKDQLLCLRLMDVPQCHWSGGFKIDNNHSFHINVRDSNGQIYFLRVEIVLQRATYFIVFTDADSMPAPIRIDNFSQVPVTFHQTGVQAVSTVRPHCSVPYALDEPTRAQRLTVVAPGGVSASYDINSLGEGSGLTYENFIYIAFTGTFKNVGEPVDPLDVEGQQLVLEVPDGCSQVVLSHKQFGARSQLWRMTGEGQLQHEGSSPPRAAPDKILVLDIAGPAPQPTHCVGLMLRRPDKRRKSTQTWRFTEDGRLCCIHNSLCVQAKDGFFGLRQGNSRAVPWQLWSEVVLGPSLLSQERTVPLEQLVNRQRLRPGSGFLTVKVLTDGPTRVLQISDVKDSRMVALIEEGDWTNISSNHRPAAVISDDPALLSPKENREFQMNMELPCIGISLVSRQPPEELVYIKLSRVRLSTMWTHESEMLDACVQDIQVDNQLFEAQCPVILYVTPPSRTTEPEEVARPAIQITGEKLVSKNSSNAEIIKHLVVRMKNMSLNVEERLLLKLFAFTGFSAQDEQETADESDFETQRILAEATSVHAKRYYFGSLKLIFCQVRLSVATSSKMSEQLSAIKRKLGLTLIKFQDAAVELEPFIKRHIFENSQFLLNSIIKHYKEDLMWQAAIILGSTDFLGNPLGFVSDLSEGVSGLMEGNVKGLVQNVTHGLSNSAAKFSESLSDSLGRVILDTQHEEVRRRIRKTHSSTSGDHLVAGLKGLGFGLVGGVTSVFKQTYEGVASEGLPGLFTGLGKGIVGTVTKPVVGMLDFTSETASAVRVSSRSTNRKSPERSRPPRCVSSATGLMPLYNQKQSRGQLYLYTINHSNYSELFMAYEVLRSGSEDLRIVISSEMVRVFSGSSFNSFFEVHMKDLVSCHPLSLYENSATLHYIELAVRVDGGVLGAEPIKRPRVRCDNAAIASWASQQVNHALTIFVERQHTLMSCEEQLAEE